MACGGDYDPRLTLHSDLGVKLVFKAVYLPEERALIRFLEISGDDPPLLWLHGLMCASTGELVSAAVQPELRGRRQLLIDLLGYGYSDRPLEFGYTLSDHARTIAALIDALALTGCSVIGHSMGGGVGILVAAARPNIVSLLILAEGNLGPGAPPHQPQRLPRAALGHPHRHHRAAHPEGPRRQLLPEPA